MPSSRRSWKRARLAALLVGVVLGLAGLFQHGLWTPDEPREAEIGREMLASGFSALPTLGGEPFVEKPPLFPWTMAAAYGVLGVSPGVARLPAFLFGVGAVLVAFELGRRAGGRLAGLASAIVLATSLKFAEISHAAVNDVALTFFVGAGHLALLAARDDHRLGRRSFAIPLAGILAGLAFLTKAWIGPILLAGPPMMAAAFAREWSFLRRTALPLALACFAGLLLLGLPWVLCLAHGSGWELVRVCLVDNAVGRTVGGAKYAAFGHARGPFEYLFTFPASFLPWTIALPAALAGKTLAPDWRLGRARFLGLLVLAGLVLLSIPSGKRDLYALPLFPAASVVPGVWLSRIGSRRGSALDWAAVAALFAVLGLFCAAGSAALVAVLAGEVPPRLAEIAAALLVARGRGVLAAAAVVLALSALTIFVLALRRTAPARSGALAALGFALLVHAGLRPLIDPVKDLRRGALEAADPGGPLLGFQLDETTLAVVPFYSGRFVRNLEEPDRVLPELERGPARGLLLMQGAERRLDGETLRQLEKVKDVRFNPTRSLSLYRWAGAR